MVRRLLPVATLALVASSLALVGPATADAPASRTTPTTAAAGSPAAEALSRATLAVASPGVVARPSVRDRRVDATLALRDLFLARPALDESGEALAGNLLARPTDGRGDPYADGYTVPSSKICNQHFCVHYVTSTDDAAPDLAWVRTTLSTMNQVWAEEIDRLGYDRPPGDGRRGGNARFDVYLKNLGGQGLYGYCAPEKRVAANPSAASSFCVLDNDFSTEEFGRAPVQTLRVTAAHEFFHAVQFGYDYREDPWLLETTATWMEERFADDVNDNRSYLPYGQVKLPSTSLDLFAPAGFNQYANFVFWEYVTERWGNGMVRKVWQRAAGGKGRPDDYSIQAVSRVLAAKGGLSKVFAAYAAGNTVPGRTYDEGGSWPSADVASTKKLSPSAQRWRYVTRIDHLASKNIRMVPTGAAADGGWKLRIKVDGPRGVTSPAAYVIVARRDGSLQRTPLSLDAGGNGSRTVAIARGAVKSVTLTLANVSTRYACNRDTGFSCQGRPTDQNQTFKVTSVLGRG